MIAKNIPDNTSSEINTEIVQEIRPTESPASSTENLEQELSVAIYPYIPDVELFESVLLKEWEKLEPNVTLNLERWDCYTGPSECDVLMYDAIALSYLAENGFIQPISWDDIAESEDIVPFALEGTKHNGLYYGAPYFLCGDILIYYKDDPEMAAVQTIAQLHDITEERRIANPDTGVVIYTEIDNPYHYLDASIDLSGQYSMFEEMPDCGNLNEEALHYLDLFNSLAMKLPEDKLENSNNKELFCEGYGFAYYGVSEHMSYMDKILDKVSIKNLSFSEGSNVPLYYVDVTSVASHVTDPEKLNLCKKLMNLVASENFLEELCYKNGKSQYFLPARKNVYLSAAEQYPMYGLLHEMVSDSRNKVYRFGVDFYTYLEEFRKSFTQQENEEI